MTSTSRGATPLNRQALGDAYVLALEAYLACPEESALSGAYDVGRRAMLDGLSPLDLVSLHESALEQIPSLAHGSGRPAFARAMTFLLESLSPFELTYRRFMESNVALRGVNEALENQSRRTARQIHDGAGQILFSLQLALAELMAGLPSGWKPQFDHVMQLADHLDQQLRSLSRDLYPVALDDLGLNAAVRHLLDGVATRAGLHVSFHSTVSDRLPPQVAISLYRAIHEGVTNVVRHAKATELSVRMEKDRDGIVSTVTDNGVGMASPGNQPAGLGLRGIRDRLKGLHGELEVRSTPGNGTRLIIAIPVAIGEQSDGN
jgi:two-component system, NarL family, sensor histidine kinase UhpB